MEEKVIDQNSETNLENTPVDNIETKVQEDINSYSPKKVRFIKNIIQMVIWIVLLFMANQYLNEHPAERSSMISGMNIIYQKVKVMVYNVFSSNDWKLLDEKYNVERNYSELVNLAQESACATWTDKIDVQNKLNQLIKASVSEYEKNRMDYNNFAVNYYKKLKLECTK